MPEKVEEKTLILDLGDGKEVDLKQMMTDTVADSLKAADIIDENGKFKSAMSVEVKDAETKKMEGYEKAANFIKSITLPQNFHAEYGVKAISTDGGSFGSVVPTELYNEIIEQSKRWTVIRQYAFVFAMSGKLLVPKEGTAVTGYWVAENAAVTESNPTTGSVSMDDFGVAALIMVSWKLLKTSPQNIVKFVSALAAKAITDKEEAAFVNGDGSDKPKGFRTETVTSVAQAGASFTYDDLLALYFSLPIGFRRNAQFATSAKGARLLYGLKDDDSRPLFPPGSDVERLFNKPLIESEDIPANLGVGTNETEIWIADLFNYWIKDGSNIEIATQDKIENLQTKIVVYKYVDGRTVNTAAFRKLTGVK